MNRIFLALVLFQALTISSCKQGGGDPKEVMMKFFEALSKNDMTTARSLATKDSKGMIDLMEMGINMSKDKKESLKFDKANLQFGEVKIDGDRATIPVTEKTSGESLNYIMVKEDGAWKMSFDLSSLMNMGTEKMKEKGMDPSKAMNELKGMKMDSMKAGMKKGMEMLDSLKNAADKMNH